MAQKNPPLMKAETPCSPSVNGQSVNHSLPMLSYQVRGHRSGFFLAPSESYFQNLPSPSLVLCPWSLVIGRQETGTGWDSLCIITKT